MPTKPPSVQMRAQLRARIQRRIDELNLQPAEAAERLGLTRSQLSHLRAGEDIFSLDRLVEAASAIGLTVRLTATRPYG